MTRQSELKYPQSYEVFTPKTAFTTCFFLIFIITLLIIGSASAKTIHKPPFTYFYWWDDSTVVIKLDDELKSRVKTIEETLGNSIDYQVDIFLTYEKKQFNKLTSFRVPHWAGGVAYPHENRIVVKAPVFFGQGVPLEVLTAHEITHLVLHDAVNHEYLPRWFDEGVCIMLSGEVRSGAYHRISKAVMHDKLIPLPKIDRVLGFSHSDADLAYAEAGVGVKFLVDYFGWDAVRRLLDDVRKGVDFDDAFIHATGMNYEEWQIAWFDYMRRKYRWGIFLEFDNLVWMLILFLALVSIVAVQIRKRRQYKKWQQEEEDDDEDNWEVDSEEPYY